MAAAVKVHALKGLLPMPVGTNAHAANASDLLRMLQA
jgi:hypothetical protein